MAAEEITNAPPRATPALLAQPGFRRLWLAQTLSTLGDRVHQIALTWWTLATTGSLALTGAMLIATTLPMVLLGPLAGTLADRWPRGPLMVVCDLLRAMLVAGIALLAAQQALTPLILLVGSAVLAGLTALFTPAAMSAVPALVAEEDVLRATSWMEGSQYGMGLLGPALGGLVVAVAGPGGAFALNGVSFLYSGLLLVRLALPGPTPGAAAESFGASLRGGFAILRDRPAVGGALAGFAAVNVFTTPVLLFMPYFARSVFQTGAVGLGELEAALGGGMLLAAIYWARAGAVTRYFPVVFGGLAGVGLAVGAMGLWPLQAVHLAGLLAAGLLMGSVNVVIMGYFQARVPAHELGRFFGLLTSLTMGLVPMAFGVYGLLAGQIAPATLLEFNGLAILLVASGFWLIPGFRHE